MANPKRKSLRRLAKYGLPHTHPAFRPYVVALGELALAWNELH